MELMTRHGPAGLSSAEAASLLAAHGENVVAKPKPKRLLSRIGAQLADPLVTLLLIAAVVTSLLGDWTDTLVIALVVALNTAIGVVQQTRADKAVAALDDLTAPAARVVRDGVDQIVPAAELVTGDLVRLEAGDIVPADMLLAEAVRCRLDESALTGESLPVAKDADMEVFAGTVLVIGRAAGTVVRTGADSAMGKIAGLVAGAGQRATPLQRRIARLGRILGAAAVLLCAVVFAVGVGSGAGVLSMALVAVSLVVAAVPESLPAVVTLALALGARRMARHNAIPRSLHAVETLGSVTVIASDKTGTLTEGRMAVQEAVGGRTTHTATGHGYGPAGVVTPEPTQALRTLTEAAVLCSDATIAAPDNGGEWKAIGDPMEAALVTFAARCGVDADAARSTWPRVAEYPFDQATRRMSTVHRTGTGYRTVCKGAPESVLALVVDSETSRAAARAAAEKLAAEGLRVIAVAESLTAEPPADPGAPVGLSLLGIVGIGDPLRDNATGVASIFDRAGIRLILITGDHPGTASAIAARIGIWTPGDAVGAGDRPEQALDTQVFARTKPEQKLDIIAALQADGQVVAMTGDGVNDAPALRRADIGVAMGGGTEVARQAADLVLVDDNLETVAAAVGEGRRVYDNIRRFLRYGLAGGTAEILVMLAGPLLGMPIPLLPAQILWINLLTHGLPGVALGAEPAENNVLRRRPRAPGEQILGDGLWRGILLLGSLLTAATLAAGVFAEAKDWPWQSVVFATLGLSQLGLAVAVRARRPWRLNLALPAAVALSAVAQIAAVTVPPLRTLLGTEPLSATQLAFCAAVAIIPALILWITRKVKGQ
ncbi:cation-transporting P-type ATPase [Phytomonospora sp. NPDC050363]|uniref:cation-translocating P-type ATPase n=1 Tax=Phytomonospora sp. NPDC050363 TaxID=3155642 RepID=UPI0033D80052